MEQPCKYDLGRRIREARKSQNLTLQQLSDKTIHVVDGKTICVTVPVLSRYEVHMKNGTLLIIRRIAAALGVPYTDLVGL